ncbi:MAG: hypothetical protein V7K42_19620 [Nostoc sp.]
MAAGWFLCNKSESLAIPVFRQYLVGGKIFIHTATPIAIAS